MTPSSAFSTGEWQDQQKKQQPAAPGAAPQQPATPPPAPQTWGQHNTQQQERQRSYYGQQAPQQPQQMPAQAAGGYGMPMAQAPQPVQVQPTQAPPAADPEPMGATFGAPQSNAVSQPGSFLQDAQVDPLPPEMPQEMPKPQTAHHAMPQQTLRPPRSYYGQ